MSVRLIIEWEDTDGATYSCRRSVPVSYDSAEAFAVDFEAACKANQQTRRPGIDTFKFGGQDFWGPMFFEDGEFVMPSINTVDEWFAEVEK
jgi:hypothetical protein